MLSIIYVNYRSGSLILDSLNSIRQYDDIDSFEIIVVDNNSRDESEQLIRQHFPDIKWFGAGYNAGFARGNNIGFKESSGDVCLLLNPDTLVLDDSISKCYKQLKENVCVAAGVQLLDKNLVPQNSGSAFVKWGLNHLLPIPYWGDFLRWAAYQFGSKAPGIEHPSSEEGVDWISGAFLMVKKEAVEQAGLLDEDFFLYAEEVEWCSRLKKTGKLYLFGNLKVIHLEGETINKSQNIQERGYTNLYDRKGLQLMVSNHLRVRKQYGITAFIFLLLNYSWGVPVFFSASFFDDLIHLRNPFAQWKKGYNFLKNVLRLWGIAPRIISNKPYFYKMF